MKQVEAGIFFVKILFELSSIYVPLLLNSLIVVTLVAAGW